MQKLTHGLNLMKKTQMLRMVLSVGRRSIGDSPPVTSSVYPLRLDVAASFYMSRRRDRSGEATEHACLKIKTALGQHGSERTVPLNWGRITRRQFHELVTADNDQSTNNRAAASAFDPQCSGVETIAFKARPSSALTTCAAFAPE